MLERSDIYAKELEEKYEKLYKKRNKLMDKYNFEWVKEYDENGESIMKMAKKGR